MPVRDPSVITVFSARPDGATSVAVGLAALLSRLARVLLVDLRLNRPEIATLLDIDNAPNLYQLSLLSRLSAPSVSDLELHVQWRDGLGVLAGIPLRPEQREDVTDTFVEGLVATAASRFDHVVVDLGRPRLTLPSVLTKGVLAWVVTPSPLGLAALDRAEGELSGQSCAWLESARIVLNRVHDGIWTDADRFISGQYGLQVAAAQLPMAPDCWQRLEKRHSLAPFCVPVPDRKRYLRAYGQDCWAMRQALEGLADALLPRRQAAVMEEAEA